MATTFFSPHKFLNISLGDKIYRFNGIDRGLLVIEDEEEAKRLRTHKEYGIRFHEELGKCRSLGEIEDHKRIYADVIVKEAEKKVAEELHAKFRRYKELEKKIEKSPAQVSQEEKDEYKQLKKSLKGTE